MTSMPSEANTASKLAGNFASRSWRTKRIACPRSCKFHTNCRGGTRDPLACWPRSTARQMNSTRANLDEEENKACLQAQGFHGEEITRQELRLVLVQEGPPGAALSGAL